MSKWHVLVCLLVLQGTAPLWAQAPGFNPAARPTVSPWLNLNRRGTSPAVNLYGLVRPQMNFTNAIQQLQQEVATSQPQPTTTAASDLPATGHVAGFLNHHKYFMNRGGVSGTNAPTTAAKIQPRPARRSH